MFKKFIGSAALAVTLIIALMFGACAFEIPPVNTDGPAKQTETPKNTDGDERPAGGGEKPFDGIWTNDNAVYVTAKSEDAGQVFEAVRATIEPVKILAHYVVAKYPGYGTRLLVILDGGKAEQEAAVARLYTNPSPYPLSGTDGARLIEYAYACTDVPFETENTLRLTASSAAVAAGDEITVTPEGAIRTYRPTIAFDTVSSVSLANYDAQKEYTPADFPQAEIVKVEKYNLSYGVFFTLTLAEPGYFNVIKAVDAFARDPAIRSAELNGIDYLCFDLIAPISAPDLAPDWWSISDPAIADFTDGQPFWEDDDGNVLGYAVAWNANGGVTVRGLQPGKATITYMPASPWDFEAAERTVTLEITVYDPNRGAVSGIEGVEYFINNAALVYPMDAHITLISDRQEILALHERALQGIEDSWELYCAENPNFDEESEESKNAAIAALCEATEYYSSEFFETKQLVLIWFETPYAAYSYRIKQMNYQNETLSIEFTSFIPGVKDGEIIAVNCVCGWWCTAIEFTRISPDIQIDVICDGYSLK